MLVKNCYVELNASFQLEKDDNLTNATAFGKVLSSFLGKDVYNNCEEELTEKLWLLGNIDFNLSQRGKLVTKMTQHASSTGEQNIDNESNDSQDDNDFQATMDSILV